jgi:hypothetical protein
VAVRRTAGWGISQSFVDHRENAFQIPIDFIVPESKNIEALAREVTIPSGVALRVSIEVVLAAINFNDQLVFQANEIHDEIVAWSLTPKVITALASRA